MTDAWIDLCAVDAIEKGRALYVEKVDRDLAVVRTDEDTIHVLDNRCPHAGGALSAGAVRDGCIVCPWHMWAFDLASGACPPAPTIRVKTYICRVREGRVEVNLRSTA